MNDIAYCKRNLDRLLELEPLSTNEDEIALMQFSYICTEDLLNNFIYHPIVNRWVKQEKLFLERTKKQ